MTEPENSAHHQLTPLQTSLIGAAVLITGAVLSGGAHYTSTTKKLIEEGIAPSARIRALPLAGQALAVSTVLCAAFGGAALAGWHFLGLESRSSAEVSTFTEAVALAKRQRDLVRQELRASLFQEEDDEQGLEHSSQNGANSK